jgi:hypothetical protein
VPLNALKNKTIEPVVAFGIPRLTAQRLRLRGEHPTATSPSITGLTVSISDVQQEDKSERTEVVVVAANWLASAAGARSGSDGGDGAAVHSNLTSEVGHVETKQGPQVGDTRVVRGDNRVACAFQIKMTS